MFERFRSDERAIEGLPIRLVIALVIGVACLSVMMSTISGLGSLGVSEVDVRPSPEVVGQSADNVTVTVVDASGDPVSNATVIAKSGSAKLAGVKTATTGSGGRATIPIDPTLGPNQAEGTIKFDVKPPGGNYADRRQNTKVLVVRE